MWCLASTRFTSWRSTSLGSSTAILDLQPWDLHSKNVQGSFTEAVYTPRIYHLIFLLLNTNTNEYVMIFYQKMAWSIIIRSEFQFHTVILPSFKDNRVILVWHDGVWCGSQVLQPNKGPVEIGGTGGGGCNTSPSPVWAGIEAIHSPWKGLLHTSLPRIFKPSDGPAI